MRAHRSALSIIVLLASSGAGAAEPFERWLEGLRAEALRSGISPRTLEALAGIAPLPDVIAKDRRQIESQLTFEAYRERIISAERIARGRELLAEHRGTLDSVSRRTGVPPELIVALWGVETFYGRIQGDYPVLAALATLAHDGRRAAFFRRELLAALRILDQGHITAERFKGSWAGAMGHCQFMPTTFLAYAVDGSGDGRKDIWGSLEDVFASIGNFVSKLRWRKGVAWGVEARVEQGGGRRSLDGPKTLAAWEKLGVSPAREVAFGRGQTFRLVRPSRDEGPAFLVTENFGVLRRWNNSSYFVASVGLLADALAPDGVRLSTP